MSNDKEIKKEFKAIASKDPDRYYATGVLKKEGFERKRCSCGIYFWTTTGSKTCGDPACSGGFRFIGKSPAKEEMDYIQLWQKFSKLFSKWGYTPIKRYPVVARWRDDTDFVQASIYDFQPYVVTGEVKPPANPLVVPQFSLRFNDIDNVGITGAHYTGFVMIGQHAFMPPEKFEQEKYFTDIHNWLKRGLGLKNDEITFHEDAWAGGGNFGPCMEYFSRGLELGNQVYMLYEQTPSGKKELNLKVLDMGMGHERNAWFTKATATSYETTFPTVVKKLYKETGINPDAKLMEKFLPYSSYLNVDEVEDIDKVWKDVEKKIKVDNLKKKIMPLAALYSVAEHSRTLLVALSDGALPSNVGGGYNLRVILRRALSFIEQYGWNIDLNDLTALHADYLKPIFPELSENLEDVKKILDVEKSKFEATRQKSKQIAAKIINEDITEKRLLELYDSQGIAPELLREEAEKAGKKIDIPDNFYARVAELHGQREQQTATVREEKLDLHDVPATEALYFDDYEKAAFKAKVVKVIGSKVILDRTYFYPTSGGQLHDLGTIQHEPVVDIFKQGSVIVHVFGSAHAFPVGEEVSCEIDMERRKQLAQHHTATHIVNAAARRILGHHINQAGAKKTKEKATLDITHYQSLADDEMKRIEEEANKIIKEKIPVRSSFMPRDEAEKKYGMSIYQGGAVPGNRLRIVEIPEVDAECCGGTHLKNTAEAEQIRLLKSTKISDSIVRITFTAGNAAGKTADEFEHIMSGTAIVLGVEPEEVPDYAAQLFAKWKEAKKAIKKLDDRHYLERIRSGELRLELDIKDISRVKASAEELVEKTAAVFKTQKEHITKTAQRFKAELKELKRKIKEKI